MGRYDTTTDETWEIDPPNEESYGFPYTFPFVFDRENNRYSFYEDETWVNEVS